MKFKFIFKRVSILILCMSISWPALNCKTVQAYDGEEAAEYAEKHWKNYNSSYPKFNSDCTNFVSQCVKKGGIKVKSIPKDNITYWDIDDIYKTKDYWNCAKYTRSLTIAGITIAKKTGFVTTSTWSVVAKKNGDGWWGFYNYMKQRGASTKEYPVSTSDELNDFIKGCAVGDILQVRSESDSTKKHSVIVTERTYNKSKKQYNMKISYHTTDTKPTDFRTVSWKKFGKDQLWTVIKVSKI